MRQAHMKLAAHRARLRRRQRIEQLMPLRQRQDHDIVGGRLRGEPWRQAGRLEQRIRIWEIHDALDLDLRRRQARALDGDAVADGRMKIGRRLLSEQHALECADQRPNLAREIRAIGGSDAQYLAGARGLHRCAGMGDEARGIAIADRLQFSIAGCLGQGFADGFRIGAGSELDLPIDRHRSDRPRCHAARAHDQESAEQGEERHGESDTGRLAQDQPRSSAQQSLQPNRQHGSIGPKVLQPALRTPCGARPGRCARICPIGPLPPDRGSPRPAPCRGRQDG